MKKLLFIMLLIALPSAVFSVGDESVRMPDTARLLAMLYSRAEYQPYRPPGSDSETTDNEIIPAACGSIVTKDIVKWGNFYGDGGIDTPEEYYTAVYCIPVKLDNAAFQKSFSEEFPAGKEGYMRLVSVWMKTGGMGRDDEDMKQYEGAVVLILKAASKGGIALSRAECAEYYKKAVSRQMNEIFGRECAKKGLKLSPQSLAALCSPWLAHFTAPSADARKLIDMQGMALVDLAEKKSANKIFLDAYDAAVRSFTNDGFQVNFNSDREYYRSYDEDLVLIQKDLLKKIPQLKTAP